MQDLQDIVLPTEETGLPEGMPINEVQKLVLPIRNKNCNIVVASHTGTGKSTVACMIAHKFLFVKPKMKVVYVAPMKALVEEKRTEWSNRQHPFSKFKTCVISGDWSTLGVDDMANESDIISITPESLASRIRNSGGKKSWIDEVGILVVDEVHLLGEEDRGATLEACLIEFSYRNPEAQIVLLSGTIKNKEEITGWAETLNKKQTHLVASDWRAVPLDKHFIQVKFTNKDEKKKNITAKVIELLQAYPDDQFLVGVFSKAFGRDLEAEIRRKLNEDVEFHNADKKQNERAVIENRFRSKNLRILVCTKTLAVGMNLPARRVILTDCSAGGGNIPASELNQFAGRAGRKGLDDKGDVYFILPCNKIENVRYHIDRIQNGEAVKSQLNTTAAIALHFLGAMWLGRIKTHADFYDWYSKTLMHYQRPIPDEKKQVILENIIKDMSDRNMIVDNDGDLKLKKLGIISSQMAVDPYYLHSLNLEFNKYFKKSTVTDMDLIKAFVTNAKSTAPYVVDTLKYQISESIKKAFSQEYWASAQVYSCMLNNETVPSMLLSQHFMIKQDVERITTALIRVSEEVQYWKKKEDLLAIQYRLLGRVEEDIAKIMAQGATKPQAKKLHELGITDILKAKKDPDLLSIVQKILK